ncbi:MAG: YqgE/AlgH family protein [Cyclobacteriaceae bacterium]|nr:YqgE/AlgH family protein [Cyclobacteriaceae bacterium]
MDFDFFKYTNKIKPEKGRLLISEPFLNDPTFERTVVLLCEHNEDGSFGFILNKPSESSVNEVLESLSTDQLLHIGGPVQQDTLHYLHRIKTLDESIPIAEDVFWGGDFDQLQTNLDLGLINEKDIRFFLGYSGWAAGQLEEELKQDSWIVSSIVTQNLLFETPADEMWRKALSNMGGRFSVYSNYPKDPNLN